MKCTNCQGEWTPPQNVSLSKCPFCHTDILQMLNKQAETLSTEAILSNMLQVYGNELLQNQQRLSAMISDLFAHDPKSKRLLLLSVRENIPMQLTAIEHSDTSLRNIQVQAIQHSLAEDSYLKEEAAEQIVTLWITALCWEIEEPDHLFEIVWKKGYCGFKNSKGVMITPYKYDYAENFSDGLALVKINEKYGYINENGIETIPVIFSNATSFNCKLAKAGSSYINLNGEPLFYAPHSGFGSDLNSSFSDGLAIVNNGKLYGYIDTKGELAIDFKFSIAGNFIKGIAKVCNNTSATCATAFINKNGDKVSQEDYLYAGEFCEGLALVHLHGCGFINEKGDVVISFKYEAAGSFSNGLAPVRLNLKYGFINKNEEMIIPFIYDDAKPFNNGVAYVKYNGAYGFINLEGQPTSDFKYSSSLPDFAFGVSVVRSAESGKYGLVNEHGYEITSLKYDFVGINNDPWSYYDITELFKDGLVVARISDKYGFLDFNGEEVIPIIYEEVDPFGEEFGGLSKVKLNGRSFYINKIGIEISIEKYSEIGDFIDGFRKVKSKGYGFVDYQWNEITKLEYDSAKDFSGGFALVETREKFGFIDKFGVEVFKLIFDSAFDFKNGFARVINNNKYGFININGGIITPFKYDFAGNYNEGMAMVKVNDQIGYIDESGKEAIPIIYSLERNYTFDAKFTNGLALVGINGKYGFINKKGEQIISLRYDGAEAFSDGVSIVNIKGKYGCVNPEGIEIIPLIYTTAKCFFHGFSEVSIDGKYFYINKQGKRCFDEKISGFNDLITLVRFENNTYGFVNNKGEFILERYSNVKVSLEGWSEVKLNNKYGYINKNGQAVTLVKYDKVCDGEFYPKYVLCRVKLNNKWGFVDRTGQERTPLKYDKLWPFYEGLAKVQLNDKFGVIDINGKEIAEIKYDSMQNLPLNWKMDPLCKVKLNGHKGFINRQGEFFINNK